jgi:hypothetical protein
VSIDGVEVASGEMIYDWDFVGPEFFNKEKPVTLFQKNDTIKVSASEVSEETVSVYLRNSETEDKINGDDIIVKSVDREEEDNKVMSRVLK